jgi:general secretion pathway protein K
MRPASTQRGVALITAIIVVAIGTMIAVNLMWQGTLDLRRADAALAADQGLLYVQGAEAWAADILRQDLVDSPDSDHLGEQWAFALPPLPVDGGTIIGKLEDLQGRFNLNNLIGADGRENELARRQLERLLFSVEADPALAGAVVDWLDPDTEQRFPTGGEDVVYSDHDPPYRTANSAITSASELMAVAGFDRETYRKLAPYLTVLPAGTKLNVNTASDVVLASLSDDIDIGTAGSLVEQRADAEFIDINETFEGLVEADVLQEIDGVSEHFLLTATVTLGSNQLTMRSVLQRDRSGITRAVFRSLGVE